MLEYLLAMVGTLRSGEEGQTTVEYALVLLLVAIVLVGALALGLTGALSGTINDIKNAL